MSLFRSSSAVCRRVLWSSGTPSTRHWTAGAVCHPTLMWLKTDKRKLQSQLHRQNAQNPSHRLSHRSYSASAPSPSTPSSSNSGIFDLPLLLEPNDSLLINKGIPGLYSPQGFAASWTDWQSHLVDGLNKRVVEAPPGSTRQTAMMRNLIRAHARSSDGLSPAIFNYASSAWNNEFFFRGLNYGLEDESAEVPKGLLTLLELDFFSMSNLKEEMLGHAASMFSGGFVWLVRHTRTTRSSGRNAAGHHAFSILRTYASGSPLPEAHFRVQLKEGTYDSTLGTQGSKSRQWATDIAEQGTLDVWPVLGVSVWEHSYMTDYGVRGRDEYLDKWWNSINWDTVAREVDSEEAARDAAKARMAKARG
jgi:Fe-Mn family superoxide dismutase